MDENLHCHRKWPAYFPLFSIHSKHFQPPYAPVRCLWHHVKHTLNWQRVWRQNFVHNSQQQHARVSVVDGVAWLLGMCQLSPLEPKSWIGACKMKQTCWKNVSIIQSEQRKREKSKAVDTPDALRSFFKQPASQRNVVCTPRVHHEATSQHCQHVYRPCVAMQEKLKCFN